ncbi:branched-chain amino acid ABC transporter [Salmonella enterica subsp. salamae]|nr:branched-chain amino acid ABC transporter [Salmonella enterica subsp. salamae]
MAGVGLTLLYLALFRLGSDSATLVDQSANGAAILHAYVQHTFGGAGSFLLAALIFIACLVTAVGLTCACAEFFAQYIPLSYRTLVFILGGFSMVVSNLGLSHLIQNLHSGADGYLSAVYRTGCIKFYPLMVA